jgi:hypothetical protein
MWTAVEIDGVIYGLGESADGFGTTDPAVWRLADEGWATVDIGVEAPGQQEIRDVAVGRDGTVVAVGIDGETGTADAAIWRSTAPGLTEWEAADGRFDVPGDQQLLGVVATDRGFVAMGWTGLTEGSHDGLVWTSRNGLNWRRPPATSTPMVQLGGSGNQEVRAIAEFGRLLVAVGVSGGDEENAGLWIGAPTD